MTWPGAFAILFGMVGFACWIHGFPNITIGGTHNNHYHNQNEE